MILGKFPVLYPIVSQERDGVMSKDDKIKLDGIEKNANNYKHPNLLHAPTNGNSGDYLARTSSNTDGSATQWVKFPESLKNPKSLKINVDNSTVTYDGSEEKSITIPKIYNGDNDVCQRNHYLDSGSSTV